MLSTVYSAGLRGVDGYIVTVECDVRSKEEAFEIVGLPDASIKESKERIKAAVANSGMLFPSMLLTVNLAPADLKKEGTNYDLPIAVGILAKEGLIENKDFEDYALLGELSLDGELRPVVGILPIVLAG